MAHVDHHRQFGAAEIAALQKSARVGIGLDVDQAVRRGVAGQEALQPDRVGAMRRADQHDGALLVADEADAAKDEGAHDHFADVALGDRHAAEIGVFDADHPALPARPRADEGFARVEEVDLAGELAREMDVDDAWLAGVIPIEDFDRAIDDDEEIDAALAAFEQHRVLWHGFLDPELRRARDLVGRQPRKGLPLALIGVARIDRRLADEPFGFQLGVQTGFSWARAMCRIRWNGFVIPFR